MDNIRKSQYGKTSPELCHPQEDVTLRLYAGDRHEILNETDREQVYQDLYEWMQSKMEV